MRSVFLCNELPEETTPDMWSALMAVAFPLPYLLSTTLPLRSGGSVSLYGRGPPVLFSTGLLGTAPHGLYSEFVKQLTPNVTIVVFDGPLPLTGDRIEEIADAIAVERIGILAHSSTDGRILYSRRVGRAVLCDPIVLPPFVAPSDAWNGAGAVPILVIRAGLTYIPGDVMRHSPVFESYANSETITFDGMGHADLLDDAWADLGTSTFPWLRGRVIPPRPFRDWTFTRGVREISGARRTYRTNVAFRALEYLLREDGDESQRRVSQQNVTEDESQ